MFLHLLQTLTWRPGPNLRYGRGGQGFERHGHFFSIGYHIFNRLVHLYEPVYNDWITLKFQRTMPHVNAESVALLSEDHKFTCP